MKTLIIDNYDSFTFNLYQLVGRITGTSPIVIQNDSMPWESLVRLDFDCVIISPGPGRPDRELDFGLSKRAILELGVPLLGVCLGHQGICHAFGGSVIHAPEPMHGRLSSVYHDNSALFANVPNPFSAVRYHSLACARPLPPMLLATAWTVDGIVMGLAHRTRPIWGVQFHPESISTEHGKTIVANFVELTRKLRLSDPAYSAGPPARSPDSPRIHRSSRARGRLFVRRVQAKVDAAQLFASLFAHLDNAFWLDSSLDSGERARFSFMGGALQADAEIVRYYAAEQKLVTQHGRVIETPGEDVLAYLNGKLGERLSPNTDLPFDFNCGFVGYFGYELKTLCGAPAPYRSTEPDCILLFAGKCIAIDHQSDDLYLLYSGLVTDAGLAAQWFDSIVSSLDGRCQPTASPWPERRMHFVMSRTRDTYLDNISKCLEHIRNGESYEICLTNKLRASVTGDPFEFYKVLRRINPAPYSAYLKFPDVAVACSSPERFLQVRPGGAVESKPIKGTMRRGADAAEDTYLRQRLNFDIKSQAENLMIVDLLRNDLGKVCELGSVGVPELMKVETYATLHQLVSTITGQLRTGRTAVDCFRAAFPGGSMTGAPKLRTMAIIDELEREARGVYSGSIGYFALNGAADLNIVIRTAVFSNRSVTIGVGGAVVAMSDPGEEWREILLKAQALLSAFQSVAEITTEWQD
jgi:para-aminobenzoate synthetase